MTQGHPDELAVLRIGDKGARVHAVSSRQLIVVTTMLDPGAPATGQHDSSNGQARPAATEQDAPPAATGAYYELRVEILRADDCDPQEIVEALDGWALQYDCIGFDRTPDDAMWDDACDFAVRVLPAVARWANSTDGQALLRPATGQAPRGGVSAEEPGEAQ